MILGQIIITNIWRRIIGTVSKHGTSGDKNEDDNQITGMLSSLKFPNLHTQFQLRIDSIFSTRETN